MGTTDEGHHDRHANTHAGGGGDEITQALDQRAYPIEYGDSGSKPVAGISGRQFFETDTEILWIDNGSSWIQASAVSHSDLKSITSDDHHTAFTPTDHDSRDHSAVADTMRLDELAVPNNPVGFNEIFIHHYNLEPTGNDLHNGLGWINTDVYRLIDRGYSAETDVTPSSGSVSDLFKPNGNMVWDVTSESSVSVTFDSPTQNQVYGAFAQTPSSSNFQANTTELYVKESDDSWTLLDTWNNGRPYYFDFYDYCDGGRFRITFSDFETDEFRLSQIQLYDEVNPIEGIYLSREGGEPMFGSLNMNNNNLNDVASIDGGGDAVVFDDILDLNSNDLEDAGTIVWDTSAQYIPQGRLQNDSVTVAGNSVSLGSSTAIDHSDLSNIGFSDHHTSFTPTDHDSRDHSAISDTVTLDEWAVPTDDLDINKRSLFDVYETKAERVNVKETVANEEYFIPMVKHSTYDITEAASIQRQGNYLYIGCDETNNIMQVWDITEKLRPKKIKEFWDTHTDRPVIFVKDEILYECDINSDTFATWDISEPSNPSLLDTISDSTKLDAVFEVDIKDGVAFVTAVYSDRITAVDISDPTNLSIISSFSPSNVTNPYEIKIKGNYAYVTGINSNSFHVIDISDPSNMNQVDSIVDSTNLNEPYGVNFANNDYAIVTDRTNDNFVTIDVTDPTNISISNVYTNSNMKGPESITVKGNYCYIGCGGESSPYPMLTIKITDPNDPKVVSSYDDVDTYGIFRSAIKDNILYAITDLEHKMILFGTERRYNEGSETFTSGYGNIFTITHNVDVLPNQEDINVNFNKDVGRYWIDNIDSDSFDVNIPVKLNEDIVLGWEVDAR